MLLYEPTSPFISISLPPFGFMQYRVAAVLGRMWRNLSKCCKQSYHGSFCSLLWSIAVLGALTFSSSALCLWQMQLSTLAVNQSSKKTLDASASRGRKLAMLVVMNRYHISFCRVWLSERRPAIYFSYFTQDSASFCNLSPCLCLKTKWSALTPTQPFCCRWIN